MAAPEHLTASPARRLVRIPVSPHGRLGLAAAFAGIAAATAAIAVSELLAGLIPGFPSLVLSMGDLVISLQPPGGKDLMVQLFGTADKLALEVMILVGALAIAALAGVLARRRFATGAALFVAFGAVAAIAVARNPLYSAPVAVISAGVAVVVGIWVLGALLGLLPQLRTTEAVTEASREDGTARAGRAASTMPDWDRRRFLIASAGTLGASVVVAGVGRSLLQGQHGEGVVTSSKLPRPAQAVPDLTADQRLEVEGITPIVVPNDDFYRIDTALLVPSVDVETWALRVTGMVERPLTLTYDQLLAMPLFEQYLTIGCVSNQVGGRLIGNALWTGVRLKEVLERAGVHPDATQIVGRSVDGFTAGFPTSWATAPGREPMIAVGMGRQPLPAGHGFPARLVVPGLYGYVSATKWLSEIELTTREAVDGYWVPLGWAKDAPMLTQSRIDTPRPGSSVAPGLVTIAGLAWAPDRGIDAVEVSVDDGEWQQARLSRPISDATWVQWALDWDASAGTHTIEVRATDGTGEVQTAELTMPAPDGARGHHRISVTAG
jgi:DMSO/TMAO reductase YedYZ molybdopterin-dependent catalytic subunit